MKFSFYNPGKIEDELIHQVTVSLRCGTKWLFVHSKEDKTWDLLSDTRLEAESLDETARRITHSVLGVKIDEIRPICPYSIETNCVSYGYLYFASAKCVETDENFAQLFDKLPDLLTRGIATGRLFTGTQGWLNMQTNADELWDVYDADRNLTGRLHRRGDFLEEGDYHLVVHVWLLNSSGEFLLTKRAPCKGFPNTWETSGGAAQAGDDSLRAALREVREETGLVALADNAELMYSFRREADFCDVWLVRQDFCLEDVVLLDGETVDKTYVNADTLLSLYRSKKLVPYSYLNDFLTKIGLLN